MSFFQYVLKATREMSEEHLKESLHRDDVVYEDGIIQQRQEAEKETPEHNRAKDEF